MITKIEGVLVRLGPMEAYLSVGPYEHEVYIPEFVRRQLQAQVGQVVGLKTIEYLEGNAQQGRLVPRLIGFLNDAERDFFDEICSVDGVGVKKALRAMVRPVRDVAVAIEEQNVKELTTLPGIGSALAERIVAKLRRKMARFALLVTRALPPESAAPDVLAEAHEALVSLGHSASEARELIEKVAVRGKKFADSGEVITAIYEAQAKPSASRR